MKVESKYNIGDKLFFFYDNKIQKNTVKTITIKINKSGNVGTFYGLNCAKRESLGGTSFYTKDFRESLVFDSLESITEHMTDINNILNHILED